MTPMICPYCGSTLALTDPTLRLISPPPPPPSIYSLSGLVAGQAVSGSLFVTVTPETAITQVRFLVDGLLMRTENVAPFALAGDVAGVLNPFDTRALANGPHTLVVEVDHAGITDTVSADFTVANVAPPPYLRLLSVATTADLLAALAAALPGDRLELALGTYALTSKLTIARSGTVANPITLIGPRGAVLDFGGNAQYRFLDHRADWWVFSGFTHSRSFVGPLLTNANHNSLAILVEHTGQEGIKLAGTSSYNTVEGSAVRETGEVKFWYGEGVYIGSGATGADPANYNQILRNTFGPNVRAEHVDNKTGTTGNSIKGNVSDATGFHWTDGSDSGGQPTTSVYANGGQNVEFADNTINNLNSPSAFGFQNWQGSGCAYHTNKVNGTAFKYGYVTQGGTGNVIGCDNMAIGGAFSNVPCTP